MAAPKGNKFWKLRSKHGRDKLFATPGLLWEAVCEYFQWCDNNPWKTEKKKETKDGSFTEETPTARPYTFSGLCFYLGCNEAYFRQFKTDCTEDFSTVINDIESVIETQQFEGAAVGAFNANIIARKLGLADKQDILSKSEVKATFNVNVVDCNIPLANSEDDIK